MTRKVDIYVNGKLVYTVIMLQSETADDAISRVRASIQLQAVVRE